MAAKGADRVWLSATCALLVALLAACFFREGTSVSTRAVVPYGAIRGGRQAVEAATLGVGATTVYLHCAPPFDASPFLCATDSGQVICPDLPFQPKVQCSTNATQELPELVASVDAGGSLPDFAWPRDAQGWYTRNSQNLRVLAIGYVPFVLGLRRAFEGRGLSSETTRVPLFLWNLSLSLFSAVGMYKLGKYMFLEAPAHFWEPCALCQTTVSSVNFWGWIFGASKFAEFVDTVFLAVRARKLMFLHVYHHVATSLYCWLGVMYPLGHTGMLLAFVNYGVHALMYAYFALACTPFKVQNAMFITVMQTVQMVFGLAILLRVAPCAGTLGQKVTLYTAVVMYLSYLVLFSKFFYERWMLPSRPATKRVAQAPDNFESKAPSDAQDSGELRKQAPADVQDSGELRKRKQRRNSTL